MANYKEVFYVGGNICGIEDFDAPGEHHFDDRSQGSGTKEKRFMMWSGGCGIGRCSTIEEARSKIFDYVKLRTEEEVAKLRDELKLREAILRKLGDDPFNLGRFAK